MIIKYILFIFLLIGLNACKNPKSNSQDISFSSIKNEVPFKLEEVPLKLSPEASKLVESWSEYQNFIELFNRYKSTTPSVALSNAKELNTLAVRLKDSIRINTLNIPPFQSRLNVLQNETMRLLDMASIANINAVDIKNQVVKIMEAFNATNAKINNLVSLLALESDLVYEKIDSAKAVKVIPQNSIPHGTKVKQN